MTIDDKIKDALTRHEGDVQMRPGAWREVERRVVRSHKRRIVAGALASAMAITGVALALPRIGSQTPPAPVTTEPPTIKPTTESSPTVAATIHVTMFRLVVSPTATWGLAESPGDGKPGTLVKIDPATNKVVARIPVGYLPADLAIGSGSVWVIHGNACPVLGGCSVGSEGPRPTVEPGMENSVWRIDESTNQVVAKIDIGGDGAAVTTTADATWVARDKYVFRIDPKTNHIAARTALTYGGATRMAAGEGWVWALSPMQPDSDRTSISRIDPVTSQLHDSFAVASSVDASDIAVGFGAAWVTNVEDARLVRVSPESNQAVRVDVPDAAPIGVSGVAIGRSVWVLGGRGQVFEIDPATNKAVGDSVTVGENPPVSVADIAAGSESVWVAAGDGNIYRIDL